MMSAEPEKQIRRSPWWAFVALGAQWVFTGAALAATGGSAIADPAQVAATDAQRATWARPAHIPFPAENPYTPEKAVLGKMLFFESRLSRDRNLSCASCHNPSFGWEVPFDKAIGAGGQALGRHAPTTLNQAWSHNQFWDGRASTLEQQARGPIEAAVEMALPMSEAVSRLKAVGGYDEAFKRVFPSEGVTETNILRAIATFERTLVSGASPFDRWLGGETAAISEGARRGFELFSGRAGCSGCHTGWNFSDDSFHDIGLPGEDEGRAAVTKKPEDRFAFKTTGLREIASRSPYMHDGSIPTLEGVVVHYIARGVARPTRASQMREIKLNQQEIQDLVAFMNSLSSPGARFSLPSLPAR